MPDKKNSIEYKRHSLAHILAMAVLKLRPNAKLGIGPAIEDGFYYDFDFPDQKPISENELQSIEKMMQGLIKQNLGFDREEKPTDEAIDFLKKQHQPYKVELAEDLKKNGETTVSFYHTGDFIDLCRGGHVRSTSEIEPSSFKITHTAGAYWKGSEKNTQMQRIYGLAFETKKDLTEYLVQLNQAKKRDHRKLGKELGLFTVSSLVGSGLPLYTPKGALLRRLVQDYVNNLQEKAGYEQVWTPQVAKVDLFRTSGHYEKFKSDMFLVTSNYSDEEMFLKPMNCPMHTQIYASHPRSWRDLPIRYADFAMLYRDEKPGELGGLSRVRAFSQDDGHVFCREDQIEQEFDIILKLIKTVMNTYKLNYWIRLSLRDRKQPENYLGEAQVWDQAERLLGDILKQRQIDYQSAEGEAAFYGPKMDLIARDSLGRQWQLSTIQLDFQMPSRFGLKYTGADGKEQTPVMIHRAINGSTERFLAIIIEHYGGKFPVWLSPVQVKIIPLSEKYFTLAGRIGNQLRSQNIRLEIDDTDATVSKKIRAAQLQFIPYMVVVGQKEMETNKLAVRTRDGEQKMLDLNSLVQAINDQAPGKKKTAHAAAFSSAG